MAVPFACTRNPLDVTAQLVNDPTLMQPMFEALLDDGGYPAAICFMAGVGLNDVMMDRLMPSFENIAKKYTDRVMVMSIMVRPERRHPPEAPGYPLPPIGHASCWERGGQRGE